MEKLPILTTAVDYVYTMQARINEKRHKEAQLRAKLAVLQGWNEALLATLFMSVEVIIFSALFAHGSSRTHMPCLTERLAAAKVVPVIESGSLVRWDLINRMAC